MASVICCRGPSEDRGPARCRRRDAPGDRPWCSKHESLLAVVLLDGAQLGPLRNVPGTAEIAGSLSGAGLVIILTVCLSLYGAAQFQSTPAIGVKTLTGRSIPRDPLQSSQG